MRVDIENLDAHRGGRPVVTDVSITVPSGTVLGLLGPNGSGKSTLLRAVSGITLPSAGRVRFDGRDITALSRRELAQHAAVKAQEHSEEFEIPVLDMVLLGRIPHGRGYGRDSDRDIAIALEALDHVGAEHLVNRSFAALSGTSANACSSHARSPRRLPCSFSTSPRTISISPTSSNSSISSREPTAPSWSPCTI